MKAFLLLAALATTTALPAAAVAPVEMAVDPLTLKSQNLAVSCPNGCVTAAVRVKGTDKGINLELTDPSAALAPLAPVAGLAAPAEGAARPAAKRPSRAVERPVKQAEAIEAQGERAAWEKARL